MDRSHRILAKKAAVVFGSAFLFLLFLYLVLPTARKYYVRSSLDLESVEKGNVVVYAPNRELANEVQRTFHEFREAFFRRFRGNLTPSHKRLRIHIFENKLDLSNYYSRKRNEPLLRNSGFYDPSDESIALVNTEMNLLRRAIRHEAVHYFMQTGAAYSSPEWSPWLSEGMASVYEFFEVSRTAEGVRGWGLSREALRSIVGPYTGDASLKKPVSEFLTITEAKFRGKDNKSYYLQARLLVCFLLDQHPDSFWRYVHYEMREGPSSRDAFRKIIGGPEQIQRELKQWVRGKNKKMEGEIK